MMFKSGAWRHEQRFHTVFGMPFGPGAAPLHLECNAFSNSENVGGDDDNVNVFGGGSGRSWYLA